VVVPTSLKTTNQERDMIRKIERIGVLYDGRGVYCTLVDNEFVNEFVYAASNTAITNWDDGTWWSGESDVVKEWLEQLKKQAQGAKSKQSH
jgi:hypothetical protein